MEQLGKGSDSKEGLGTLGDAETRARKLPFSEEPHSNAVERKSPPQLLKRQREEGTESSSSEKKTKIDSKRKSFPISGMQAMFPELLVVDSNIVHPELALEAQVLDGCDCSESGGCRLGECPCFQSYGYRECNSLCACSFSSSSSSNSSSSRKMSSGCENTRLLQGSEYVRNNSLEIFQTNNRQFGLRSKCFIAGGSFVIEYIGECISVAESKKRSKEYDKLRLNYQLAVREHFSGPNLTLKHVIDSTKAANAARFINHACEPNLEVRPIRVDTDLPRFAIFATRDIEAGEELCISYGSKPEKEYLGVAKKCQCGSKACCGYLPYDPDL